MSVIDKVTVGGTTYDLQDTKAQNDCAELKSAINTKADNAAVFGGTIIIAPTVIEGKYLGYTGSGNTVVQNTSANANINVYDVEDYAGQTITLGNNGDTDWNAWTDTNGVAVANGFKTAATATVDLSVPNAAKRLYVTVHPALGDTTLTAVATEWLEKTVNNNSSNIATNAENIEKLAEKVQNTTIPLTVETTYENKYVGYSSTGNMVSMANSTTQDVVRYDVSGYAAEKLYIKNGYSGYLAWADTDGLTIASVNFSNAEADGINIRAGAKYLYLTKLKTEDYKLFAMSDGAYNDTQAQRVILHNMLINPGWTDGTGWAGDNTPSGGKVTATGLTGNLAITQTSDSLECRVGDVIYIGYTMDSQTGANNSYATIATAGNAQKQINIQRFDEFRALTYPLRISGNVTIETVNPAYVPKLTITVIKSETMDVVLSAPAVINLTKVFGAGFEPDATTVDCILEGLGRVVSSDIDITNAAKLIASVQTMPRNGGYYRINQYGGLEMGSPINTSWPNWQYPQYSYGTSPAKVPIYNNIHGPLETDAMFVALPSFSRWCSYNGTGVDGDGNPVKGGHVFEGWNFPRTDRLTLLMANHYYNEAEIFVYRPAGIEGGGTHGRVRLGCDFLKNGFVVAPHYMESYGNIAFYPGYYPKIASPNGTLWTIRVDNEGNLYTVQDSTFEFLDDSTNAEGE